MHSIILNVTLGLPTTHIDSKPGSNTTIVISQLPVNLLTKVIDNRLVQQKSYNRALRPS